MQPIPAPHILDPDRIVDNTRGDFLNDHKARAEQLDFALHESCDYARQLWETLAAARTYLMESLPPDPRQPGSHATLSASPTGPDDSQGWQQWMAAYSSVTSALCGPQGDSGYGAKEAQDAARLRRDAPNMKVEAALQTAATDREDAVDRGGRSGLLRTAGMAALGLLAFRGLLPRRG